MDTDGAYVCPSEAPSVTVPSIDPPTHIQNSTGRANSCKYAFDGVCDDPSYAHAKYSVCRTKTDEWDCNRIRRR